MGSSMTCKQQYCCGSMRDCTGPEDWREPSKAGPVAAPPTAQLEALRKERDEANARAETAEARVAELEKAQKRDFNAGYVIACCNIMNLHRDEVVAFDVLEQLGVSSAEVRAMNLGEYDAAALKKIEGARSESPYAARRVREGEKVDG